MSGTATVAPVRATQAVLVLHITSACAWIAVDAVVAVLMFTGWLSDDHEIRGFVYRALATFIVWPMLIAGLVCLASGLLLRQSSLRRYWWVAVKLVLNLILCTLIVLVLRPQMDDVVPTWFFQPAVALIALALGCWPCSSLRASSRHARSGNPVGSPV